MYLLIVYLFNRVFPWLGGYLAYGDPITVAAVPVGSFLARLFHSLKAGEQDRSVKLWTAFLPHAAFEDGACGADE